MRRSEHDDALQPVPVGDLDVPREGAGVVEERMNTDKLLRLCEAMQDDEREEVRVLVVEARECAKWLKIRERDAREAESTLYGQRNVMGMK